MARDVHGAVREVCLSFPEAEEYLSHGSPNFRVRGKTFATYVVNHHGDGRVALWLNAPAGAQEHYVRSEPRHFFVPPYVGPRGWLGVHLDKGLSWKRIAALVRQAYEKVAPPALSAAIGKTIVISPPKPLTPAQIDPLRKPRAQRVLAGMRKMCGAWPEVTEGTQFGAVVWRAGKRVFASCGYSGERLELGFWVGTDRQGLLVADPRFRIPPYIGHNGWIALDVTRTCGLPEVRALALESYRHFASKRAVARLETA